MADRKKVVLRFFAIFLFVIGVGMLLFIANLMYDSYRSTIKDVNTTEESKTIIDCNQIYLSAVFVDDTTILIKNNFISSMDLDEMTFVNYVTGDEEKKNFTFFKPGMERELDITDMGFDTFYLFPYECDTVWNICNMSAQKCYDPDSFFE